MPVGKKEIDRKHKSDEVPQYLKAIHGVDLQGNTAKKTEQVCKTKVIK